MEVVKVELIIANNPIVYGGLAAIVSGSISQVLSLYAAESGTD